MTQIIHIPGPRNQGGYTVGVSKRRDGKLNVTICQCRSRTDYDRRLGEELVKARMGQGLHFVCPVDELPATIARLSE